MWYIVRQYEPNENGTVFYDQVEKYEDFPPRNTVMEVYIGPFTSKVGAKEMIDQCVCPARRQHFGFILEG